MFFFISCALTTFLLTHLIYLFLELDGNRPIWLILPILGCLLLRNWRFKNKNVCMKLFRSLKCIELKPKTAVTWQSPKNREIEIKVNQPNEKSNIAHRNYNIQENKTTLPNQWIGPTIFFTWNHNKNAYQRTHMANIVFIWCADLRWLSWVLHSDTILDSRPFEMLPFLYKMIHSNTICLLIEAK